MEIRNNNLNNFQSFRELMDTWDQYVFFENVNDEIEKFLTHKQILMTFIYPISKSNKNKNSKDKPKLYGTTEDGRLIFARMKSPNPDDPVDKEDTFSAMDLQSLLQNSGESDDVQRIKIFSKQDLKKIKIIPFEKAIQKLTKLKAAKHIKPANTKPPEQVLTDDE